MWGTKSVKAIKKINSNVKNRTKIEQEKIVKAWSENQVDWVMVATDLICYEIRYESLTSIFTWAWELKEKKKQFKQKIFFSLIKELVVNDQREIFNIWVSTNKRE